MQGSFQYQYELVRGYENAEEPVSTASNFLQRYEDSQIDTGDCDR